MPSEIIKDENNNITYYVNGDLWFKREYKNNVCIKYEDSMGNKISSEKDLDNG